MSKELTKGANQGIFYLVIGALLMVGSIGVGYIVVFTETVIPSRLKLLVVVISLVLNGALVALLVSFWSKIKRLSPTVPT